MGLPTKAVAGIGLHRFGMGPRPGSIAAIEADPRGALLAELDRPQADQNAPFQGGEQPSFTGGPVFAVASWRCCEQLRKLWWLFGAHERRHLARTNGLKARALLARHRIASWPVGSFVDFRVPRCRAH
jgi:hypothetical protein